MAYWLDLFTIETWQEFKAAGGRIGQPAAHRALPDPGRGRSLLDGPAGEQRGHRAVLDPRQPVRIGHGRPPSCACGRVTRSAPH